jgi:hypothetical protein
MRAFMNPASPDNSELPATVRRQLVLAQVRLLELTDAREALATEVAQVQRILGEAQAIANESAAGRDHLAQVNARLEDHARQLQARLGALQAELDARRAEHRQGLEQLAATSAALTRAEQTAADRLRQATALQNQVRAMQATRSWRWTAPLRALGDRLRGSP